MGGKRLQNVEDAEVVEVGKFYLVPTVFVPTLPRRLQVVPIIGPLHEDLDLIHIPDRHYHPDRRFVSQAWIDYYQEGNPKGHWAPVYAYRWKWNNTGMRDNGRLRLRLKRLIDSFRVDAPWLMRLEKAYCQETLRDGHICPHRGISCRGVVAESDGVVCPGHGLKWNTETGKLVSRIGQIFQRSLPKL